VTAVGAWRLLQPMARYILRGDARVISAAGAALGIEIQQAPCRAAQCGARAALWLGPDEYLLLAPDTQSDEVARALRHALQVEPHSLVDVGHRQTALKITGLQATDILNSGCPLDLDSTAFPVGMCTRTIFAKAEVVLWRTASDVFHIEVWRSFADYVAGLLNEAAQEYRDP
jgi:sarcosine oxidase subunit gamma